MIYSSDSEIFIEDNDSFDESYDETINDEENLDLELNIMRCQSSFPFILFTYKSPTEISFKIKNSFLPKSILHINDFDKNPILCEINIETKKSWNKCPNSISISNPTFGKNFIGKTLIYKRIMSFFSSNYAPSPFYVSQNYVYAPEIEIDDSKIAQLLDLGYEIEESIYALRLMNNDIENSIKFLQTGINSNELNILDIQYSDFPLFYLILEITEVFFELSDHCCICGRPLEITGIRPMVCSDKICNFSFSEIGVNANILGEIKRDPTANDLLISLASSTYQTKFFNPKPSNISQDEFAHFFQMLPSMQELVDNCKNDKELKNYLKNEKMFDILKFLILANKAHIITLNHPEIQIKECSNFTTQFLLTIASPKFEIEFQEKKKKYGNMFLWHGSNVNRWYSILHSGLKDLGRTEDKVHGPWFGDGIYQSNLSSYSIPYSYVGENKYNNSTLPKNLIILAMTENAKTSGLNHPVQNEYTQTDERACIIRALMIVNNTFSWDIVASPPKYIPTLNDCLNVITNNK